MHIESLYTADEIHARVKELGEYIDETIPPTVEPLLIVIVLRGSLFFAADLLRMMKRETELRFITASSYKGGTTSLGQVDVVREKELIEGRTVLIIEDIIDTGRTLKSIVKTYKDDNPRHLFTCAFLDKPSRREVAFDVDFRGFTIEDHFVVGYGMDYQERYRDLPYIGILHP